MSTTLRRRDVLRLFALGGAATTLAPRLLSGATGRGRMPTIAPGPSPYGRWVVRNGVPAFAYDADQDALPFAEWDPVIAPPTRRHWIMVGNRAIHLQAANDGTVAVFDEGDGLRWLVAPDEHGTGVSVVVEPSGGAAWGSDYRQRGGGTPPVRTFGPTWLEIRDVRDDLTLERTLLCPEDDAPWLLVRVRLSLARGARAPRTLRHVERWALEPRFLNLLESEATRRTRAALAVTYDVDTTARAVIATERFASPSAGSEVGTAARSLIGPPATLALERLGRTPGTPRVITGATFPTLEIETPLTLRPGRSRELWFRFGRHDADTPRDPRRLFTASLRALRARLPTAAADQAPAAAHEIPWHAALLRGGAAVDRVIGEHSLDQASAYSYVLGFNGAARDPLQHALPLVYVDPALALSVLRNTCAWATPDGDLPYALAGAKQPTNIIFRPSDQNLWALWLAAEYAAATGDLAAFDAPLPYHPAHGAAAVPLREHLRRQLRFFVDVVGRGEGGHVRILNADWNDLAIADSGVDRAAMIEHGGSVLNSAMAAWVLGVFAGLCERLGDAALGSEARAQSDELRALVAAAWNGRWFHRAYAPGGGAVGDADCWLEVQPWAILCGAATTEQARALLTLFDQGQRAGSPLGTRLRWPPRQAEVDAGTWGQGTAGGIWYAIQMTLVWAASRVDPDFAWDEWRRMTLDAHTTAYPENWEGTLSGPDAWNAPDAQRPGRTWASAPPLAMQAFPVNNCHSHAQPLLAYLRLLGVEPTARGSLATGGGAAFASRSFRLNADGHGRLVARGPVVVESVHGERRARGGRVRW